MDVPARRPYLKSSIVELEALFSASDSESRLLLDLAHELSFRSTGRSQALRARVTAALNSISSKRAKAEAAIASGAPRNGPMGQGFPEQKLFELRSTTSSPPSLDLGELQDFSFSQRVNDPAAILGAWTALEALSPQTYRHPIDLADGDRSRMVDLSTDGVPWNLGERSRPNYRLYYQVILGAVQMDQATEELIKAFGEDEERNSRVHGKAAIAAVLVDNTGMLVEENGIGVSSFAWALPLALKLELGKLHAWPKIERRVAEKLAEILRCEDEQGNPAPIDLSAIHQAYDWLVKTFEIPNHLTETPTFAIRVFHYFKASGAPETTILNSFFLDDLARAKQFVERGVAPPGLRRYLGIEAHVQTFDLLSDRDALEKAVSPAIMPAARWPNRNRYPLVLLQQAAVNLARSELSGSEGVIGVNGPPGTGKTTLLRDIVAECVFKRAMAMASFDDPDKAFTPTGEKMRAGEQAFFHLYALAADLKGHEILVASSNNKAVENISRQLPCAHNVGRPMEDLSYFKSVSDLVCRERESKETGERDSASSSAPAETWGLIAAVLGNAKNRAAFQQAFWWHKEYGFRIYLKAAKGDSVVRETTNEITGKIERITPAVISSEQPPLPETAKENWQRARRKFLSLYAEVDAELKSLEGVRQLCLSIREYRRDCLRGEQALMALVSKRSQAEADQSRCEDERRKAAEKLDRCGNQLRVHLKERPGIFARIFRNESWKAWSKAHSPLAASSLAAAQEAAFSEQCLASASARVAAILAEIRTVEAGILIAKEKADRHARDVNAQRPFLGDRLIDDDFFECRPEIFHKAAPWIPEALHRKREDLFISALAVHKAFIDASAQKVLHNLSNLMTILSSGPPSEEAKRKVIADLWSTLFLVVPVVSTTFASVERMYGDLPSGSIGWLLIDEAGQALPQAAVGAIMRAKRSIVVGDPQQIPPVVTMPDRLVSEICKFFRVEKALWASPEASAQTLADRASKFQASFGSDEGPRRVGIPLLVHRRCQQPMFGISNEIAYNGQMVHGTRASEAGAIENAIGPSAWFNVDGDADSKWCPAEGEQVVQLLSKMASAHIVRPDIFIITPFRIVMQELRRRLAREELLFSQMGVDITKWVNDSVGTIHTVQGREAEAVILVLGAPKASQHGARNWATGTPNILNVAVSRAKQNLYIVGSRGAWSGVGYARKLCILPHGRV